jgi:hypothetical protein
MNDQLGIMKNDYQDMLVAREEAKKQLDAKFQDIHRTFDFSESELRRAKDTLKAFNSKFSHNLKLMREEYEGKINNFREFNRKRLQQTTDRLDHLENLIIKERNDRIEELNNMKIDMVKNTETATRIEHEKEIRQTLDDNVYQLEKTVDAEKTERNLNVGKFKDEAKDTLYQYQKSITDFQTKSMDEFNKVKDKVETDIFVRLEAQDDLVDNLSNSIKNFQETLKKISD